MYYFYIVRCSDNSFYSGQTNNLKRRIREHNFDKNKSAKYLRAKKPVNLVYFEEYSTRQEAMKRESQVKKWPRAKKESLIAGGFKTPPYFKQAHRYTCSLAVLRMVLAYFKIKVSEKELIEKVERDYGAGFKNLWNPTIAKLSCEYGIKTTMYAAWPLFKKTIYPKALAEFKTNPEKMNYKKYEHLKDSDKSTEPLPLAYKEMFRALELGCRCVYGKLTAQRIKKLLAKKDQLIQTSVKLDRLYPGKKEAFHSILLYQLIGDTVYFHDPTYGKGLSCQLNHLLQASQNVGAAIVYGKSA